jgi:hypothetical protein
MKKKILTKKPKAVKILKPVKSKQTHSDKEWKKSVEKVIVKKPTDEELEIPEFLKRY